MCNKIKTAFIFTGILLCFLVGIFGISDSFAIGEAGAQFLKIGVGSKACAMGEAFVALADDPSAIYWNPAGLSQIKSTQILGMHSFWLEDMSCQYLSSVFVTGYGNLGVAISYSSSGDIPGYNEDFQETGTYTAYDAAGTFAYANVFKDVISYGIGLKLIQQKIEEESATGFAVDLGLLHKMRAIEGLSIGLALQNLGPKIKFIEKAEPLPITLKGGLAYTRGAFTLVGDLNKPNDNDLRVNVGGEFVIAEILALRAGYETRSELDDTFTAGVGIGWKKIGIGYAYVPHKEVNDTHRISLKIGF